MPINAENRKYWISVLVRLIDYNEDQLTDIPEYKLWEIVDEYFDWQGNPYEGLD